MPLIKWFYLDKPYTLDLGDVGRRLLSHKKFPIQNFTIL